MAMEAKDWVATGVGIAAIATSLGLGIANSASQGDSEEKQAELSKQQKELSTRITKATENIELLQAKATVIGISWSVDDPTNPHQIVIENRSDGSLHKAIIHLRETRSQTSRVRQFLHIGTVANCARAKYTVQDGVQINLENFNRGSFVFETDTGVWSRPYPSGLVFLKTPPPDAAETAKDISRWASRKDEKVAGCA